MNREQWCGKMCGQIKFRPDHSAVWAEMKGHMDDKRDALVASGLSVQDAETAAVAAMGDPEEVGRQMNAIHKPLLGWLWKISGWVLALAVVFFALSFLQPFGSYFGNDKIYYYAEYLAQDATEYESTIKGNPHDVVTLSRRLFYEEPVHRGELDRYTVSTERTALWRFERQVGERFSEYRNLYALLTVKGFLPTERPLELDDVLYGVDSLGNRYGWKVSEDRYLLFYATSRTLTAFSYELAVGKISPDAEWLELRCEGQPDFCLRIDLTGGEGA